MTSRRGLDLLEPSHTRATSLGSRLFEANGAATSHAAGCRDLGLGGPGRGEAHHPPRPCAVLPELAEAVCTGRRGLPGTPSFSFFPTSLQNKRCLDSVLGQVCAQPPPSSALFAFRGALLYLGGFVGLLPAPFHSLVIILIRERGAKGSSLLPSVTSSEKTTNRLDGREA